MNRAVRTAVPPRVTVLTDGGEGGTWSALDGASVNSGRPPALATHVPLPWRRARRPRSRSAS